jgi:hypothetical protein
MPYKAIEGLDAKGEFADRQRSFAADASGSQPADISMACFEYKVTMPRRCPKT